MHVELILEQQENTFEEEAELVATDGAVVDRDAAAGGAVVDGDVAADGAVVDGGATVGSGAVGGALRGGQWG